MNKRIDVEIISAGQPRPYADSIYEAILTFSFPDNNKRQYNPPERVVRETFQLYVQEFAFDKDDNRPWYVAYLEEIEQLDKGKWRLKVVRPYDD